MFWELIDRADARVAEELAGHSHHEWSDGRLFRRFARALAAECLIALAVALGGAQ